MACRLDAAGALIEQKGARLRVVVVGSVSADGCCERMPSPAPWAMPSSLICLLEAVAPCAPCQHQGCLQLGYWPGPGPPEARSSQIRWHSVIISPCGLELCSTRTQASGNPGSALRATGFTLALGAVRNRDARIGTTSYTM